MNTRLLSLAVSRGAGWREFPGGLQCCSPKLPRTSWWWVWVDTDPNCYYADRLIDKARRDEVWEHFADIAPVSEGE